MKQNEVIEAIVNDWYTSFCIRERMNSVGGHSEARRRAFFDSLRPIAEELEMLRSGSPSVSWNDQRTEK